jgi:hypothetical protein
VRTQVLLALADGRPGGLDWLAHLEEALDDPVPPVRAAALNALGRARADVPVDRVLALVGDEHEIVRMEVPACLLRLVGHRSLTVLDAMARDPRWRVRLAAIRALADLKTRAGVERLVEALGDERGRLREDVLALLQRLTGRPLGPDVDAWRAFLAEAPDDFLARADEAALTLPRYAGGITYHDVPSASRRFVLVTDLSTSMETRERRAASGEREYAVVMTRLEIAIGELARLMASLDESHHFDLVTFRHDARAWRGRLEPAGAREIKSAVKEIRGYRAHGSTNVYDALVTVFDMAQTALDATGPRPEDLDTVFLLTDGAPTAGELTAPELLLEYVRERNRTLKLRVHCIALSADPLNRAFLQELAAATGGAYVERVRLP